MTNGTNPAEPGLNAELTEDQLFAQIQETMKSGTEADLNKVMESKLAEPVEIVETQPESQPAPVAAATEEVKPVEAVPAPSQEDWFAALPADVQEKVNAIKEEKLRLEHKIRSDEGRVPSLQRQNEELKRKLQGQRPEPQAAPAPDATSKSKLDEKIAAIREVDPVLADTLQSLKEELAAPIREEVISRTEEIKSELRQKDDEELWNRENTKLLAAVPLAHEVFKHPQYKQWKEQQTEGVLALATSIYADDVLIAFDKFSKDMARQNPQMVAPVATTETPAKPAKPVVDAKTNNVVLERERKLNASAPAAVSGTAKAGEGLPDDEDRLFAHFQEQIRLKKM